MVDSILNPSGSIDKANALVVAITDAIVGGDFLFQSASGSDITALLEAYQSFRGSSKRQLPTDR